MCLLFLLFHCFLYFFAEKYKKQSPVLAKVLATSGKLCLSFCTLLHCKDSMSCRLGNASEKFNFSYYILLHCKDSMSCRLRNASEKFNFSYYILLHLITSYSSYFGGKKGISGDKTGFFFTDVAIATASTCHPCTNSLIPISKKKHVLFLLIPFLPSK